MSLWHCPSCSWTPGPGTPAAPAQKVCPVCGAILAQRAPGVAPAFDGRSMPPGEDAPFPPPPPVRPVRHRRLLIALCGAALVAGAGILFVPMRDAWLVESNHLDQPAAAVGALGSRSARVRALALQELERVRDSLRGAPYTGGLPYDPSGSDTRAQLADSAGLLTAHLDHTDRAISGLARGLLDLVGAQAIPRGGNSLFHMNPGVQRETARWLADLGAAAMPARTLLVRSFTSTRNEEVRSHLIRALASITSFPQDKLRRLSGRPLPELIDGDDPAIAADAIAFCARLREDARTPLSADLGRSTRGLLRHVRVEGGMLTSPSAKSARTMQKQVGVDVRDIGGDAAELLTLLGESAGEAALRAAANPELLVSALVFLSQLRFLPSATQDLAVQAAGSNDPRIRHAAAILLAGGKLSTRKAFDALLILLADPVVHLRLAAARGLESFQIEPWALPDLLAALNDPSEVGPAAAKALCRLPTRTTWRLASLAWIDRDRVKGRPPEAVSSADAPADARSLAAILAPAVAAAPHLLASDAPEVRRAVLRVLLWSGTLDDERRALVLGRMDDPDPGVRLGATEALARLAPEHFAAREALVKAIRDDTSDVRKAAGAGLARGGSAALDALFALLADPEPGVRTAAATALGQTGLSGDAAEPCLKALAPLLEDPSRDVRYAAVQSLAQLGDARARQLLDRWSPNNIFNQAFNDDTRRLMQETLRGTNWSGK